MLVSTPQCQHETVRKSSNSLSPLSYLIPVQIAVLSLAAVGLAAPADLVVAKPYINSGAPAGPLTPAVGDLVATPKGYRSLALEGFSEDLNQDGLVYCKS